MDQETKKPYRARFRVLTGLFLWSLLVAGGYVIWQVQDNAYWTHDYNGITSLKALLLGLFSVGLIVYILSYIIVRAWRHLPARRKVLFWFGLISVVTGILWCSFLFWQSVEQGRVYSLTQVLLLLLLWSAVFLTGWLFLYSLKGFFRWLLSWRILKRCLLCFSSLIVLVVVFYAEENWRGQRAWNHYRQELELKGEQLDFAAFIPPPVPEEQNFAMAPVVVTTYVGKMNGHANDDSSARITVTNRLLMTLERRDYIEHTNARIGS